MNFFFQCREKLFQRERLVVHDYKINRGLAKACRENIKIYHCRDETSDKREIRLAQILLCLENALHRGTFIKLVSFLMNFLMDVSLIIFSKV